MDQDATFAPLNFAEFDMAQSPVDTRFAVDDDDDNSTHRMGGTCISDEESDNAYGYYELSGDMSGTDEEEEKPDEVGETQEDWIDTQLNNAVHEILREPASLPIFATEKGCEAFVSDRQDALGKAAGSKGNILHRLIYNVPSRKAGQHAHLESVVANIVTRHPTLLDMYQSPDHKNTPLYDAIITSQPSLVLAFMKGFKQSGSSYSIMRNVLKMKMKEDNTCLHIAFEKRLKEQAIQAMLEFADDEVLAVQNSAGMTPLHLAVNFQDCTVKRKNSIMKMLRISNTALSARNKKGLSFFMYHVYTRNFRSIKYSEELKQKDAQLRDLLRGKTKTNSPGHETNTHDNELVSSPIAMRFPTDDRESADETERSHHPNGRIQGGKSLDLAHDPERRVHPPITSEPEPEEDHPEDTQIISRLTRKATLNGMNEGRVRSDPIERPVKLDRDAKKRRDLNVASYQKNRNLVEAPEASKPTPGVRMSRGQTISDITMQSVLEQDDIRYIKDVPFPKSRHAGRGPGHKGQVPDAESQIQQVEESKLKLTKSHKEQRRTSEEIKEEIKLECMRKLSPKETSRILYGNNPESRQISLDFQNPIDTHSRVFESSMEYVVYDEVLQYVHLPAVTWTNKNAGKAEQDEERGRGREDVTRIFALLRSKGVKRVVKVTVEDCKDPAHSDSAIVEALKGFRVEILHWLKMDLDPFTILSVGEDVRELKLRWSGSNTALRAWSDPYGLRRLKHLEKVSLDLVQEKNLESDKATEANVASFKLRMNQTANLDVDENDTNDDWQSTPKPSPRKKLVHVEYLPLTLTAGMPDRNRFLSSKAIISNTDNHKWLDTMEAFGKKMENVWETAKRVAAAKQNEGAKRLPAAKRTEAGISSKTGTPRHNAKAKPPEAIEPVVVALIDDGANTMELQSTFGEIQLFGKSLSYDQIGYSDDPRDQRNFSYAESTNGHGTVMAHMIYQVCPMVKLYVIRMEHKRSENGTEATIDPDSAAEAVKAAVDQQVNIISMSWTVSKGSSDNLRKAITEAHDKNILMFASSSDGGHFSDDTWPVAINRDWFFRIGAATAEGTPFGWAGSIEDLDYILPGVDVARENLRTQPKKEAKYGETLASMRLETGSSVATALAAGTAAMLLTCVKMAVVTNKVKASVLAQLQKREHMASMLKQLDRTPNRFLQVWIKFDTRTWKVEVKAEGPGNGTTKMEERDFADSTDEEKLELLATKIQRMIPSEI